MNEYEDYRLEAAEDAAVNNSQTAKRVAMGLGAAAVAGGAAFAATQIAGNNEDDSLETADLLNGAGAGEVTDDVLEDAPQPTQEVHVHHHYDQPEQPDQPEQTQPEPHHHDHPQDDGSVEFNSTEYYYDEDGNLMGVIEDGKVNGYDFRMVDVTGDGVADAMGIDYNRNGVYEDDEIKELDQNNPIFMGNADEQNQTFYQMDEYGNVHQIDPYASVTPDEYYGRDESDGEEGYHIDHTSPEGDDNEPIDNDYDNKNSEEYRGDLADDNPDYNNNAFGDDAPRRAPEADNDYARNEEYIDDEGDMIDGMELIDDDLTYEETDSEDVMPDGGQMAFAPSRSEEYAYPEDEADYEAPAYTEEEVEVDDLAEVEIEEDVEVDDLAEVEVEDEVEEYTPEPEFDDFSSNDDLAYDDNAGFDDGIVG